MDWGDFELARRGQNPPCVLAGAVMTCIQLAASLFACAVLTFVAAYLPRQGATFVAMAFALCALSLLFLQANK
ncbi:hypothetical protein [Chitinasiproducens palmae]|nr:hypothetical protein [Chitinasiproducens palmae]